ncbi:MAG: SIMPL domain-containing protein [Rhizomicrobium sp.]
MKFAGLTGLAVGAALGLLALAAPAAAADISRTITVSGQGEARGVPDQAELSAGVATVAVTADAALAANARKMTGVFDALKHLGVPERAIQTSNFSVQPQYAQNAGAAPERITGYQVSNQVDVTLDDTKKLGPALDALVGAGANQINSVGYDIRDPGTLQTTAREAAIADALKRAQTYAKAAGATVGAVLSIQENGTESPRPMFRVRALAGLAAAAPTPTAAGELSVTANVTVVFELK